MTPFGFLPMWKPIDETNLRRRVRRFIERPLAVAYERPAITGKADWCVACKTGDHCKPARVGPYDICVCLNCETLVLP